MLKFRILFGLMLLGVIGCASWQKEEAQPDERLAKFRNQEAQSRIESERKRVNKLVLAARKEARAKAKSKYPIAPKADDNVIYADILRLNQARDLQGVEFMVEELLKRFPRSVHADNALFIAGQLNLSMGLSAESLKYFERIIQDYPLSHKHSAALFHKGVAYRKLKLFDYSTRAFADVQRIYPGSPESYRVELELKLLKLEQDASL